VGQERHGDVPVATRWAAFSLDETFRAATGMTARKLAVLFLEPDKGWHTYSDNPGPLGKPTRLTMSADGGKNSLAAFYPPGTPQPDALNPSLVVNAYAGRTPLFVPLDDGAAELTGTLELLLCTADKCMPVKLALRYRVPDGNLPAARGQAWWPRFAATLEARPAQAAPEASATVGNPAPQTSGHGVWTGLKPRYFQPQLEVAGILKAVLFGLLAGFILNFMPCVLPVISIKLSALVAGADAADAAQRTLRFREHNLYFALGALLYFLCLGAILGATGLAWGQLFQRAEVVLVLAALIFALALSLFGVFTLPVVDLKFGGRTAHPKSQALFTGLLATLLATPCSGPFLGGVLGWTLLQPAWVISAVFLCVGLGMALPYLVMALFPGMARLFPKPGPWTGHLEKIVGLLLMGTSVYLLGILPGSRLLPALVLFWLTACAAWLWGLAGPGLDSLRKVLLKLCAVALAAAGLFFALRPADSTPPLDDYAEAALRQTLGRETVVVDFTADWCPSCKALEQTTLAPARLAEFKKRYGLRLMRADLTGRNPDAESLLQALGSQSIPLLAIFPKDAPERPLVLRDLFTPSQLEEALETTARP
jgi:thiol:disulfide interchange protein DsbD